MNELAILLNKAKSEGLTVDEKERFKKLRPYQPHCQCDTKGEGCKLHGIKYKLEVDSWVAS